MLTAERRHTPAAAPPPDGLPGNRPRPRPLTAPRLLRALMLVVAVASALLGAVIAVLPALIVGFVTLFYDSAGGVLVFLGSLLGLLPHSFGSAEGVPALPVFQQLDAHPVAVVVRSAVATVLCATALAVLVAPSGKGEARRRWLLASLCCLLAALAGGRAVAFAVVPAIAISLGHQLFSRH